MIGQELGERPTSTSGSTGSASARPTGIDYPAEEMGIVPTADEYSGSSIGNLPIGQGLSVTPLQMMAGYAAIANGGVLRSPRLIEAVDGEPVEAPEGEQVISEKTSDAGRKMLEGVLGPFGTAPEVSVPGYVLAGKTGTAQKVVDGDLLRGPVHPLVRRLRAGRRSEAAGLGRRRRPEGRRLLRRHGRRARLRRDRRASRCRTSASPPTE